MRAAVMLTVDCFYNEIVEAAVSRSAFFVGKSLL